MLRPPPAAPASPPRPPPFAPTTLAHAQLQSLPLASDGTFSGYASLFDVPDQGGDIVARGAFTETLTRLGPSGIRLLFQHDPKEPVGVWTKLAEDARGLRVEGALTLGNSRARDLDALLRAGAIDGLSIGFKTITSQRIPGSNLRRLTRVDLWEISIVTFPMLFGARISGLSPSSYPRSLRPSDTPSQALPLSQVNSRPKPSATAPLEELTATIRSATQFRRPPR